MDYNDKKLFIYQFIIAPKEAITYLLKKAQNEYFKLSWIVLILCLAFNFLSIGIINLNKNHVFGLLGFKFVLYTLGFLGNVFIFIGIVYFSKILFFSTDLKRSKTKNNEAVMLIKMFNFSYLPFLFTPMISLIALFLKLNLNINFYFLFKLCIYGWIFYLQIFIIKELFKIKLSVTLGIYIIPLLGFIGLTMIKFFNLMVKVFEFIA